MQKPLTFLAPLAIVACLAIPAYAEEQPNLSTVVATVNGKDITLGHMIIARASLPQQYQQMPDEVLFKGILDQLVQQTALVDTFTGDTPARVTLSLENEKRSLIAGEIVEQILAEPLSVEDVEAAYDAEYADFESSTEFSAAHILVETEEEAKAIKAELDGGADFAALAREKSTGPSKDRGGDLGWFGAGAMVPEFEKGVTALEPGGVSEPVKTKFGWHVIKLNETRQTKAPAFEEVKEQIEQQVRGIRVQEEIERITAAADVDRTAGDEMDPSLLNNIEWLEK